MTIDELEKIVTDAGLTLISKWAPRFLVSLRVEKKFGTRRQAGKIVFESQEAFLAADKDEVVHRIVELREALYRASQRDMGDVENNGVVRIGTAKKNAGSQAGIGYPAH